MNSIISKIGDYTNFINRQYWLAVIIFNIGIPSAIAQTCVDTYALGGADIRAGYSVSYHASSSIYTPPDKKYIVEDGARASFRAGKRIELNRGFRAEANAVFFAIIEACPLSVTEDVNDKTNLSFFPNPCAGLLTINSPTPINSIKLTDINGFAQIEKKEINSSTLELDISNLKNGFYILEIISGKDIQNARVEKN